MPLDQNGKYFPLKQNPKFSSGELVKIRLDRCGKNNKIYYYAATETVRHKVKLDAEDVGIYLEEHTYHCIVPPEPKIKINTDEKFGGFILTEQQEWSVLYPEGTVLHKVLFGEHGIVFVGRHFLKRVKA